MLANAASATVAEGAFHEAPLRGLNLDLQLRRSIVAHRLGNGLGGGYWPLASDKLVESAVRA